MTPEAIAAIRDALPNAMHPLDPGITWPDTVARVPEGSDLWDELEDGLFPTGDPDDPDPLADRPDSELPPEPVIDATRDLYSREARDGYGRVEGMSRELREHFGEGWPGAPGDWDITRGGAASSGHTIRHPVPDICAFYLPWHHFGPQLWGIYLLVEGIEALGQDIRAKFPHILSRANACRAARLFLYHHEAYHNAVETFAARVEVSHRQPCYLTGVKACGASFLPTSSLHEEGLANAYAHTRVRRYLFTQTPMSAARRLVKRSAAAVALRAIFRVQSPAYASAERILNGSVSFDDAEHELQEACHALSSLNAGSSAPGIWLGAPRAMAPSLSRNKSFSYVVSHAYPSVRRAAQVPQFKRREVVRRLHVATGAHEDGGGEHPKVVLPSGKRVSIPGHQDLARGTIRNILRQAGISMPLTRFMGASDTELRGAATAK